MLTLAGGFLIYVSVTTLKIKDVEDMAINGNVATKVYNSKEIKLLTWNVGYGAQEQITVSIVEFLNLIKDEIRNKTIFVPEKK